jgi:Protein of unknown function (DUF1559)
MKPSQATPGGKSNSATGQFIKPLFKFVLILSGVVILLALILPAIDPARGTVLRVQCESNHKQIGLALHYYHDAFGCFPPAYIADEQGRPMHSWRVLILPYLDGSPLHIHYRFDEPWDGPNNRRLHETILSVYNCPAETSTLNSKSSTNTNYLAVVGTETVWPGSKAVSAKDVTDGLSDTLMIVETANSGIHWMEPRDLHVLQMAPTINSKGGQGISSKHVGGCVTGLLADCSVQLLSDSLPTETLRALLTRQVGEQVGDY